MCKLGKLLAGFVPSALAGLVKVPITTINGQRAVKIIDTGGSAYLDVSETATPELMRIDAPGSGTLDFTVQDSATTITAPPARKVLDGSRYGS